VSSPGIPADATEREVSHVFRPFPGFLSARLIPKTSKNGRKYFFCFVDFENEVQATVALSTLQGYRFHWKDNKGLKLSFATPTSQVKTRKRHNRSRSNSRSPSRD
jgi:hypothetical protein